MKAAKRRALGHAAAALSLLFGACSCAQAGAVITIVNQNAPGEGFNDPTPVAPVGGNSGTTLGQQRLIAFQHAADIWGRTLASSVPIRVGATFIPLACTDNSAVLGSAGPYGIDFNFDGAPRRDTWYPSALSSKIAGVDRADDPGDPHIRARFNSRLGLFPDCLPGSPFYLGLDNKAGTGTDLVTVLLHEMGHGLGFLTLTDGASGEQLEKMPSIWDHYLLDNRTNKLWAGMSDAERQASAISGGGLSWSGTRVTSAVPGALDPVSVMVVSGPGAGEAAGSYAVGDAAFGPALGNPGIQGALAQVVDQDDGLGMACTALGAANAAAVKGNIALLDRGACNFAAKARHVQDAGAIGMVVADNEPGEVTGMGGGGDTGDAAVVIPAVRVTQADGVRLKASLKAGTPAGPGVTALLGVDPQRLAGTDGANRILLYTPREHSPGSSVSHFTTDAKRNQLMEPSINADLTHEVSLPRDLSLPLLQDIGW